MKLVNIKKAPPQPLINSNKRFELVNVCAFASYVVLTARTNMRELVLFQWLVFFALQQSLSVSAIQNAFTFFKRQATDLPGPTMSFNKSFNSGIFEFELKTFVERALILYQDDEGYSDYFRFVYFCCNYFAFNRLYCQSLFQCEPIIHE